MNREIKFRGKDSMTGKWCYGDLAHNQKVTATGLEPRVMVGGYEVVPETVGQFTGLCDKDGKEIYEGDIFSLTEFFIMVVWDDENARYILSPTEECKYKKWALPLDTIFCKDAVVIGNIHDNPELLKGGVL